MPSRQTRRKQRGGAIAVVQALIAQIRNKQSELETSVSSVTEQDLSEALETAFTSRGGKETEADIRFYVESMLKDEKTADDLFPSGEMIPDEYVGLIGALSRYSKMRNDMDTLIKSIYRYMNLRVAAYSQPVGPVQSVPYQGQQSQGQQQSPLFRQQTQNQSQEGLPEFTRKFGGQPGNYSKNIPQFSRNFGGPGNNEPNVYNNSNRYGNYGLSLRSGRLRSGRLRSGRLRSGRTLRKKN